MYIEFIFWQYKEYRIITEFLKTLKIVNYIPPLADCVYLNIKSLLLFLEWSG